MITDQSSRESSVVGGRQALGFSVQETVRQAHHDGFCRVHCPSIELQNIVKEQQQAHPPVMLG